MTRLSFILSAFSPCVITSSLNFPFLSFPFLLGVEVVRWQAIFGGAAGAHLKNMILSVCFRRLNRDGVFSESGNEVRRPHSRLAVALVLNLVI